MGAIHGHHGLMMPGEGGGAFSPLSLYTSGGKGLWYDSGDLTTMAQDSAGTTPVTTDGQPVGRILDKSGRGNHGLQPSLPNRLTLRKTSTLYRLQGGGGHGLSTAAFAAGTLASDMDCFMLLRRDGADQLVLAHVTAGGFPFFGVMQAVSGSATGGAGSPTYHVNGVAVPGGTATTRIQLMAAIPSGAFKVVEIRNLNLSAWTAFGIADYTGFPLVGGIAEIILAPAQTPEVRTQIRAYLAAKAGITL